MVSRHYPADLLSMMRDLWWTLLGWQGYPHWNLLHIPSTLLIGAGFVLLAASWRVLYAAQRQHIPAVIGPYARLRHPQYAAFVVIMLGFCSVADPMTLLMFRCYNHVRAACPEEREALAEFGEARRSLCCDHASVLSTFWPYRT
jgi:protein-S-isoprenylcysteine O-methyltransferase Ste14